MGDVQKTDKLMRIMAIITGIIALGESILKLFNISILQYDFGLIGGLICIILSIFVIFLGIKPITHTPAILGVIGILIIIFGVLLGGLAILLAAFIGALS
ncbi:MAG: hypothetical protein EU516_00630 [Promethearchaeota archaeon]|nr:MAG: hypothetical protein EU516_00630 [Candidatus Lokiarchaeota archaeon]